MSNQIIVDYLAFTMKNDSETELVGKAQEFHRWLEKFCEKYCNPLNVYIGGHMYTKGYISTSGFRTFYGGDRTGNTLFVQISGSGCVVIDRYYEGGLRAFMDFLFQYCPKITRLDLAADETGEEDESEEYNLDPERIDFHYRYQLVTGSARVGTPNAPRSLATGKLLSGYTMYFGSRKSDCFMRIYDKKSEQKINGPGHWMRCELELHGKTAIKAFTLIVSSEDFQQQVSELYRGLCLGLVRFIDKRETNVTRSVTSEWWTNFLDGCTVGIHWTQEAEYKTIHTLMDWIDHSVLGAIAVIYNTYGFAYLKRRMDEFVKAGRLSAAHANMIYEFDREEQRIFDEMRGITDDGISSIGAVPDRAAQAKQLGFDVEVL